jgi:hypothetical protein
VAKVKVFPTRKNCFFFLIGLKMVIGVGFCKMKVDNNFLLVLKIKCTKFHQDRSKTVDLHTKYTNKQTFSFIYIHTYILVYRLFTSDKYVLFMVFIKKGIVVLCIPLIKPLVTYFLWNTYPVIIA